MAFTRKELTEIVNELLSGGDNPVDNKIHIGIVTEVADVVRVTLIEEAYRKDSDFDINGDFVSSFSDVPVKEDTGRGEKYSDLPAPLISLRDNMGLRQVSAMKDQKTSFTLIPNGAIATRAGLEVESLNKHNRMYIEKGRIYYLGIGNVDKVLVKMVVPIRDLGDDDIIPIPAAYEDMFLEKVLAYIGNGSPQDKTNNSNPNG